MADDKAKLEQEEMMNHQSDQEKVMHNSEKANNAPSSEVMPIANAEDRGGQNNNIFNNNGDIINGDIWWELEDINRLDTLTATTELFQGGSGEWQEWDFSTMNNNIYYENDNDWVIDDLWVFDDDHLHHHNPNNNNGGDATTPRDPKA